MTIAIDKDGNIIELYDLPASSGGGGGGGDYTAKNPISINNGVIGLKIDNQTLKLNTNGQLTANLDELGNEVNTIASEVTALQTEISTKQDTLVSGANIKTINNTSLLGEGNISISGSGTLTPELYILNDTVAGNVNLDTVEVASSSSGLQTVPVATLPVTAGWYIVTYKGLLSFTASDKGTKATVIMQTYNSTADTTINQAYSGFVGASGNNTYYVATAIMKVTEGDVLRISMQQYASDVKENHTRGFIAMRIGDI